MTAILIIFISLTILLALFWLLFGSKTQEAVLSVDSLQIETLLPVNSRHFAQISQMLKPADFLFMQRRAPHRMAREWRAERRRILGQYLKGLGQDFAQLRRLTRIVAALSPEIRKQQQWEWMWLELQFQISYCMVALKIAVGGLSPERLVRLTELITGLASELDSRISLIAEYSPPRMRVNAG
ncbi:MAG TPA: hypothetical protein VJN90_04370 [Candidatus Acidoferrales bacterium]|nr:hypothetical protein [Candidatus Acidoferrales bacterium]